MNALHRRLRCFVIACVLALTLPDLARVYPLDGCADAGIRRPLAVTMAPDAADLAMFVDEWVVLRKARGNVQSAYD